jgi:hypothetical protein
MVKSERLRNVKSDMERPIDEGFLEIARPLFEADLLSKEEWDWIYENYYQEKLYGLFRNIHFTYSFSDPETGCDYEIWMVHNGDGAGTERYNWQFHAVRQPGGA